MRLSYPLSVTVRLVLTNFLPGILSPLPLISSVWIYCPLRIDIGLIWTPTTEIRPRSAPAMRTRLALKHETTHSLLLPNNLRNPCVISKKTPFNFDFWLTHLCNAYYVADSVAAYKCVSRVIKVCPHTHIPYDLRHLHRLCFFLAQLFSCLAQAFCNPRNAYYNCGWQENVSPPASWIHFLVYSIRAMRKQSPVPKLEQGWFINCATVVAKLENAQMKENPKYTVTRAQNRNTHVIHVCLKTVSVKHVLRVREN